MRSAKVTIRAKTADLPDPALPVTTQTRDFSFGALIHATMSRSAVVRPVKYQAWPEVSDDMALGTQCSLKVVCSSKSQPAGTLGLNRGLAKKRNPSGGGLAMFQVAF